MKRKVIKLSVTQEEYRRIREFALYNYGVDGVNEKLAPWIIRQLFRSFRKKQ